MSEFHYLSPGESPRYEQYVFVARPLPKLRFGRPCDKLLFGSVNAGMPLVASVPLGAITPDFAREKRSQTHSQTFDDPADAFRW